MAILFHRIRLLFAGMLTAAGFAATFILGWKTGTSFAWHETSTWLKVLYTFIAAVLFAIGVHQVISVSIRLAELQRARQPNRF